jgi:hypothetical protein
MITTFLCVACLAFAAGYIFGLAHGLRHRDRSSFRLRRREALRRVKHYEDRELSKMRGANYQS